MFVLFIFIASQNLIVHIGQSSAYRLSSETISFVPKYSFAICRDYSESFGQISSERMIRLSARCRSVHRTHWNPRARLCVCLRFILFNFDWFTLSDMIVLSVFWWSQSRTFLNVRGVNVFSNDLFQCRKEGDLTSLLLQRHALFREKEPGGAGGRYFLHPIENGLKCASNLKENINGFTTWDKFKKFEILEIWIFTHIHRKVENLHWRWTRQEDRQTIVAKADKLYIPQSNHYRPNLHVVQFM
jgi:hypothetical protein